MNFAFDDSGERIAVDWRTPVDELEPEEGARQEAPSAVTLVERIAATFTRGDSKITALAWRFLLGDEPESMRRCAGRAGVSAAAISRRARILSEAFGLPLRNPHHREQRREIARATGRKKKRRADITGPPPVVQLQDTETSNPRGPHE